jgi:hypothetical protein
MRPQKHVKRTFIVNGKIYQSLAELARDAVITYHSAVKRQQRHFSDYELFFGKQKPPKIKPVPKKPSSCRLVNINGRQYESIKKAYESIQPKASYNTVKQRIIVSGWTDEEAFELVERKKIKSKTNKRVKRTNRKTPYIVDGEKYNSIRELAEAYNLTYPLIYNRISRGWTISRAVKEPVSERVVVNGITYRSAFAAWEAVGKTDYIAYQGRKNRKFPLDVCLGLAPIPRQPKYEINGKVFATIEEVAIEFHLTMGQINHRMLTMSLEDAIIYNPQNKGQYSRARFVYDPKLAKTIGNLYFVEINQESGVLHKIGITKGPIEKRLSPIKILVQYSGELEKLFTIEQQILKEFQENHYRANEDFDGKTETFVFSENEVAKVIAAIDSKINCA